MKLNARREQIQCLSVNTDGDLFAGDQFAVARPIAFPPPVVLRRTDTHFTDSVPFDIGQVLDGSAIVRHLPEETKET